MAEEEPSVKVKLEYPVSLENILTINYNTENLKLLFEFILQQLSTHEEKFSSMPVESHPPNNSQEDLESLKQQIAALQEASSLQQEKLNQLSESRETPAESPSENSSEIQNRLSALEGNVESLREELNSLRSLVDNNSNNLVSNSQKIEQNQSSIESNEKRIEQLEGKVQEVLNNFKNLPAQTPEPPKTDSNGDYSELDARIQDILTKVYELEAQVKALESNSQQNALSELEKLCQNNQNRTEKNHSEIDTLKDKLKELEESLRQKVDSDDFDALRSQASGSGGSQPGPSISTKDLNLLRELSKKFEEQRQQLENLKDFTPELLQDILSRLSGLESELTKKADKSNLDELQKQIRKLRNELDRLESITKSLEDRPAPTGGESPLASSPSVDSSKLNSINRRLNLAEEQLRSLLLPEDEDLLSVIQQVYRNRDDILELNDKLDKIWRDILNRFKEVEDLLSSKCGLGDLEALKNEIQERVIAVCDEMGKKFATKNELKKGLLYLEKKINELNPIPKTKREGEDAMFATKPLGGWSCASCAKQLEKLMGRVGSFNAWNKLPHRDPQDRIARAGPGFSRILATVQPELLTNRNKHRPHSPTSAYEEDHLNNTDGVSFPPVSKQGDRPSSNG